MVNVSTANTGQVNSPFSTQPLIVKNNLGEYFDPGKKLIDNIFSEPGNANIENFNALSDHYNTVYDKRLQELGISKSGQLSAEDQQIVDSDPILNLYRSHIAWIDKWSAEIPKNGSLDAPQLLKANREITSISEGFWLSVQKDNVLFTPEQREYAATRSVELGEISASLSQGFMDAMRAAYLN